MLDTIKLNSTGNLVKVAQYLTNYVVRKKAVNTFDTAFQSYIASWQTRYGLNANGTVDTATWNKIIEKLPTCSTSKNKTSAYTCGLQILLGGLTADGVYGAKTKKAVAAFQTSNGLKADGICGPKTWKLLIAGKQNTNSVPVNNATENKVLNNCVKYLQWDSKWKKVKYSTHTASQTIGNSGCGPTSMAMIMATFIDSKITPVEMCELSVRNGYRTYNSGTDWGFYKYVFKHYEGFEKFIQTNSVEVLKSAIREGALAVCSMNNKDNCFWTSGGKLYKMAPSS